MAEQINRGFVLFKKGQKVWLEATNLRLLTGNKKLLPKQEGPFEIIEVLGSLTYHLQLPKQWKIHPVFHASLLTLFKQTEVHGPSFVNPVPDIIEDKEEYEVEAILGHRRQRNTIQYLIKWKGYASAKNSWEPTANLNNATKLLKQYKQT